MANEINKRIIYYRNLAGLTQEKVSKALGMKLSAYSQFERMGNVTAERLKKVAEILNVDLMVLLEGEKPKTVSPKPPQPPKPPAEPFILTKKERKLILIYRSLSEEQREAVIAFIQKKVDKK